MINNRELRVGNWVMHLDKPVQVDSLQNHETHYFQSGPMSYYSSCSPIPLTPEILLKLGFNKHESLDFYSNEDLEIHLDYRFWWSIDSQLGEDGSKLRIVDYLHQLQNIFYSLVGKELNYSL